MARDPEEKRAYDAAYRAAHREEKRAYKSAWDNAHREERRAYNATQAQTPGSPRYNAIHRLGLSGLTKMVNQNRWRRARAQAKDDALLAQAAKPAPAYTSTASFTPKVT